jgi:hypothetical protein
MPSGIGKIRRPPGSAPATFQDPRDLSQVADESLGLGSSRCIVGGAENRRRVNRRKNSRRQRGSHEPSALATHPDDRPSSAWAAVAPRPTRTSGFTIRISASSQGRHAAISTEFGF